MDTLVPVNPVESSSITGKNPLQGSKKPRKNVIVIKRQALTTKKAVELLLSGTLKSKVCRYCLYITSPLSEMDQIMQIAGKRALYKVTIKDIVASIHPFKVPDDPNFPNKICEKCLTKALQSYLFAQKCEQSGRALRNCFEDMYEKLEKLDPLERVKKRGRQKLYPNHNTLYTENRHVIDYAEPIHNLINVSSVSFTNETFMHDLECKKCWQVLPNVESLANHEKMHPKSMWFNCRLCGKSFAKKIHIKRHLRIHAKAKIPNTEEKDNFVCKQCGHSTDNHNIHLQHIEKHKFQTVLEHLVERKMDKLCSVCLNSGGKMIEMDKMICLHGGYPELTGDRSLYNILGATVPEMNLLHNHTGTKICEKCLDYAITSYVFINRTHYIRNRLDTCITNMIECLKGAQPEKKIFIEITQNCIMPIRESYDENLLLEDDEIDETKLKVDVLEDEFRIDEESSSDEKDVKPVVINGDVNIKTETGRLVNGYKIKSDIDEFLTFKKKELKSKRPKCRYSCPVCNKSFISDYFLRKHILKHVNHKVDCKYCKQIFKSKFYLREHVKMVHVLKLHSFSSCKICGRTFSNESKKSVHEKCHKNKQCDLCSKTFVEQRYYDSHMQRHALKFNISRQKTIQNCSFCEKECHNRTELYIHVNKVHLQIKPYSCDMCDKQFYTEQNLRKHKQIHTMFCIQKCEFCYKMFKCRRNLVVHIRKHIGVKPFHCSICPETFYSERSAKQHMRKWHGGSFFCKLCKKVFVSKRVLKDHVNEAHSIF